MKSFDFSHLAGPDIQDFILANENLDEYSLVLRHHYIHDVPSALVADQIAARRKAKVKLPSFYKTKGIIYPPLSNLEQSSSEYSAQFKARLISETMAGALTGVDLSAGFGIDSFYLSRICKKWTCVDPDLLLLELSRHNHALMGATNIQYHPITASEFIKSSDSQFDFAFIDPSRRNESYKVFRLKDCEPDLLSLLPFIFEKTGRVLVKASPLLDLQQGCKELGPVAKIIVVALGNECKEVLFWCTQESIGEVGITCINLFSQDSKTTEEFRFTFSEEKAAVSVFSSPLTYLYEPNAAILKGGAFKTVGIRYGLFKLQVNTHLYTSNQFHVNFPGRIFEVENIKPASNELKKLFRDGKVNVLTRNYPLSPQQLKKKLKLQDGGEKYLLGFSGEQQKFLVAAQRLK